MPKRVCPDRFSCISLRRPQAESQIGATVVILAGHMPLSIGLVDIFCGIDLTWHFCFNGKYWLNRNAGLASLAEEGQGSVSATGLSGQPVKFLAHSHFCVAAQGLERLAMWPRLAEQGRRNQWIARFDTRFHEVSPDGYITVKGFAGY
jgi:hypothetical protein